jgi:flagellar motor component MotA
VSKPIEEKTPVQNFKQQLQKKNQELKKERHEENLIVLGHLVNLKEALKKQGMILIQESVKQDEDGDVDWLRRKKLIQR